MNAEQLKELILQSLEHERGGVEVYTTALQCVLNEDLKDEWQRYLEQTRTHVTTLEEVCKAMGIDAKQDSPSRAVVRGVGQALVFNVSNIAAVDAAVGAAGLESGMINEVRQIGALVGLAVFGALFAAAQAAGSGSASEVFVDALRLPNLILAALCLLAGAYAWRSRQVGSSAPG